MQRVYGQLEKREALGNLEEKVTARNPGDEKGNGTLDPNPGLARILTRV